MRKDLNAKRAARAEAQGESHEIELGDETFVLPVELPMEFLDFMTEGKFRPAFALVFEEDPEATPAGGEVTARFFRQRPTTGDLEEIMGMYGPAGESLASPTSLVNGGRPSSRTGSPITGATSDEIAMAADMVQAQLKKDTARRASAQGRSSA